MLQAESIELFIEDQAFSPSYELSPTPPYNPFSRDQVVSLSQSSYGSPIELTDRRGGEGVEEEPNDTTTRKLVLYKSFNTLWLQDSITGMYTWEYNWSLGQGPARTLILMV
jgi:hypothetical protein